MLVLFRTDGMLILALTDADLDTLVAGQTVEYVNPPHDPQLVQDIVLLHGTDRPDVMHQLGALGLEWPPSAEATLRQYLNGERTDRPRKAH